MKLTPGPNNLPAIYDALAQSDMNAGHKGLSDTSDNGMRLANKELK